MINLTTLQKQIELVIDYLTLQLQHCTADRHRHLTYLLCMVMHYIDEQAHTNNTSKFIIEVDQRINCAIENVDKANNFRAMLLTLISYSNNYWGADLSGVMDLSVGRNASIAKYEIDKIIKARTGYIDYNEELEALRFTVSRRNLEYIKSRLVHYSHDVTITLEK